MTPSERLLDRLRAIGLAVPAGATIRRTYAGRHQRSAGAWSWEVEGMGFPNVGSGHPVGDLLRGRLMVTRSWSRSDYEVDPYDERAAAYCGWMACHVEPERPQRVASAGRSKR